MQDKRSNERQTDLGYIYGRNSVMEAIRSGREIDKLYVLSDANRGALVPIIEKCRAKKIPIKEVPVQKLD